MNREDQTEMKNMGYKRIDKEGKKENQGNKRRLYRICDRNGITKVSGSPSQDV